MVRCAKTNLSRSCPASTTAAARTPVYDNYRNRHRYSQRQHDHHRACGQVRSCTIAPVARPRGRSHHQAYAYLLTPPRSGITRDAEKRLEAIEAAGDLGAGYLLATHDLEIRGAGELLGDEQSGQIHSVGFSMYMDMLERAVDSLRRGDIPDADAPLDQGTEVKLHAPALIPEDYLPDVNSRLILYKRIAAAADDSTLRNLQVEMIDRFGSVTRAGQKSVSGVAPADPGPGTGHTYYRSRIGGW